MLKLHIFYTCIFFRSCTDVICCLIFLVFVAGLVVVAYFGKLFVYIEDLIRVVISYEIYERAFGEFHKFQMNRPRVSYDP